MLRKILVIDDETSIQESLAGILADEGYDPICAATAEQGIDLIDQQQVDLVLLDIWMPGMDGIEALKKIKEIQTHLPVIMISGHGNIETAVKLTKMGAYDFIEKPLSYDKIILSIKNGLHLAELEKENFILKTKESKKPDLVGETPVIKQLKHQIERVAPTSAWVLIRGEHGTGKEVVAQSIHRLSKSSGKPMVELNCAAIPEELIESELFGHEKGSFTGATAAKRGKFDQADGGLLFLDEIGDMSLKTQAKILRILQEQKFERVGGSRTISVNVRVLAATNKDLEREIEEGNFRADLYWRLNVVPIHVPPLRERKEDIPILIRDFIAEFSRKGFGEKEFDDDAVKAMMQHNWPGNVRELKNLIERTVIMTPESVVTGETIDLLINPARNLNTCPAAEEGSHWTKPYNLTNFKAAKKDFEREYLKARLKENNGNISQTAEEIGLERSHLHKKVKSLALENDV